MKIMFIGMKDKAIRRFDRIVQPNEKLFCDFNKKAVRKKLGEKPDCAVVLIDNLSSGKELVTFFTGISTVPLLAYIDIPSEQMEAFKLASPHSSQTLNWIDALIKAGAYDYFVDPLDPMRVKTSIAHACQKNALSKYVNDHKSLEEKRVYYQERLGFSHEMQILYTTIQNIARSISSVFIYGEEGVRKELFAHAIHDFSNRRDKPFIPYTCSNISSESMLQHFFGSSEKSSDEFESLLLKVSGGTLFLDEIADMPLEMQIRFLRVLHEGKILNNTDNKEYPIAFHLLVTSHKDVQREIEMGHLRQDLYMKINVISLHIPPLRERSDDVALLAECFLKKHSELNKKNFTHYDSDCMNLMKSYRWPGNVRELENVIERIVVLEQGPVVLSSMLPEMIQHHHNEMNDTREIGHDYVIRALADIEHQEIKAAMKVCKGNVALAAEKLGIGQATLYRKLKQYNSA